MTRTLIDVRDLKIAFGPTHRENEVVHGLSFDVKVGETFALVGESGSGKSATALAIMGLLPRGQGRITAGSVTFDGTDLVRLQPEPLRRIRGQRIGMIFQEPMTSLNPVLSIGRQMTEAVVAHGLADAVTARTMAISMLERVGIAAAKRRMDEYPHEFSGGMRQRVMIAMALILKPTLLIADEPTTALDVTIQAQILDLMRGLTAETGTSLILITHDMGVVAEMADRVLVMRHGRAVEEADAHMLFAAPRQSYTQALLKAVPRIDAGPAASYAPAGSAGPVLTVRGVSKTFGGPHSQNRALDEVSLSVGAGEVVALVGESGSGKSTLGRAIARLVEVDGGEIEVEGENLTRLTGRALRERRAKVQMVFQDPYASLDPRFTILRSVAEPMIIHGRAHGAAARSSATALLGRVGISEALVQRYPHQLSGGQRQRVAIARALAAEPRVIVADEPTSALDVSIQSQVLDLLSEIRNERGIGMLFISHDLAVVRRIASRVVVLRAGRVLESGPTETVLRGPAHGYTQALVSAVPLPDPAQRGRQRTPLPGLGYPAGPLAEIAPGHWVAS